jgi:hypothetical protein
VADLRVELYGELVGHLVGHDRSEFDFVASRNAIDTFGLGSKVLSESVPSTYTRIAIGLHIAEISLPSCFTRGSTRQSHRRGPGPRSEFRPAT